MGFYTPTWARKLVKEDHKNIQDYVTNTSKDFRDYIDANTPFVLWLDIALIRERILEKSKPFIQELAQAVSSDRDVSNIVLELLDAAYISTINAYASNTRYKKITDVELEQLLTTLSNAEIGSIKNTILSNFKQTMVVTNVTKKNKSVMLILPKFTTLEFGKVFKTELEKVVNKTKLLKSGKAVAPIGGMFGGLAAAGETESEKSRMLDFVNANFSKLQNVGHIEVDVVSEADRKIMRAQNSPRLLQALMTLPNDAKRFEQLQLKFSKETGQATTRLKIRKRFSGSKMVFELLVEHGLSVGIPETQKDNLYKAALERAFTIGAGFTASIRKDPSILPQMETSKSINQYIELAVTNALQGKSTAAYNSVAEIVQKTNVTKTKVTLANTKKESGSAQLTKISAKQMITDPQLDLVSLTSFINTHLQDVISANMGDGSRRDVLNYRTGRFAASVKVERMSKSREGMITAFYSYMKNPYATFSDGGEQQFPKSRDPKTLISKSIREIAAEKVANRLRAVVV